MTRLALDIGTKMGWSRGDESGTFRYRPRKLHGPGMRFLLWHDWLEQEHRRRPITEIHYEYVRRHEGILAAHVYGGYQAVTLMWAEANLVEVERLSVQEIKKTWTGAGNASKAMMVMEARRRGFAPGSEDEADAIAIWHTREVNTSTDCDRSGIPGTCPQKLTPRKPGSTPSRSSAPSGSRRTRPRSSRTSPA